MGGKHGPDSRGRSGVRRGWCLLLNQSGLRSSANHANSRCTLCLPYVLEFREVRSLAWVMGSKRTPWVLSEASPGILSRKPALAPLLAQVPADVALF